MNIGKQIIDQRVHKLVEEYPNLVEEKYKNDEERKKSTAFLLLGVSAYLEIEPSEAIGYLTDGGSDGGFDAAYIVELQDSQLNVVLFQSKYVRDLEKDSMFPANAVEKAVNSVKSIFDPDCKMLLNPKCRQKVDEIQAFILDGYVPFVTYVMLNNGSKWNQDGQNHIDNAFSGQKQVEFEHFNHDQILKYSTKATAIAADINLKGVAISENFNYKRVIVGKVPVLEISKLFDSFGDKLLEKNIRRYLGRNKVNEGIRDSLCSDDKRKNFFFFNNGITMICSKFSANFLQEKNWIVKTENLQIINGGQTCKTIHQTIKDNPNIDFQESYVLIRLYEVNDDDGKIIQDITSATNSQNPVDLRDLKSNEDKQVLLESSAKELGYNYKRKRDSQTSNSTETIPSSVAAEAVLAIWREKPHLAKYKKNELFDIYYDTIFTAELNAAQMIMAVLIFRYCDNNRKKVTGNDEIDAQRPYSQYFIATLMGKALLKSCNIPLIKLTHREFKTVKLYFDQHKEELYDNAEGFLINCLKNTFKETLVEIDGRTMAAVFRRFDLVQKYFGSYCI